jgi:hypothetical protein
MGESHQGREHQDGEVASQLSRFICSRRACSSSEDQRAGEREELVDQVVGEQGLQKHVAALGQQHRLISLFQPGDLGCDVALQGD